MHVCTYVYEYGCLETIPMGVVVNTHPDTHSVPIQNDNLRYPPVVPKTGAELSAHNTEIVLALLGWTLHMLWVDPTFLWVDPTFFVGAPYIFCGCSVHSWGVYRYRCDV
jgi:hypothetical protein